MKTRGSRFPNAPTRIWAIVLLCVLVTSGMYAQLPLSTATAQNENFDGIGNTATASLPANFKVDKLTTVRLVGQFSSALTATGLVGGANLSSSASNGIYNFGAGTTTIGPDRAIGFLSSSGGTQSGNLYAQYVNNTENPLTALQISYDVEKYRGGSNPAGFRIQLFYSFDGTNWTSAPGTDFTTYFAADGSNNGFSPAPGATFTVANKILSIAIPAGSSVYLAWNYSVSTGTTTTNAQALAVDNISVLGISGPPPQTNPTATGSANSATVVVGGTTILTVSVSPGANPTSTGIHVACDLSSIGGSSTQQLFDDGTNGDANALDNTFSYRSVVAVSTAAGQYSLPVMVTDAQSRSATTTIALTVQVPTVPPGSIVISQVYGGGGNSKATLKNDFIELYNRTSDPIDLSGWTVQYAPAAGTSWQTTSLSGTIQPGRYYLVQEAAGTGGTVSLPTPDMVGSITMSATAGKVALVSSPTALSGGCPLGASVVDFVGYGSGASCYEGSGPAPAPSNTNAAIRRKGGCTDTDNNNADFFSRSPNPHNSTSPTNDCTEPPSITLAINQIQGTGTTSPFVGQNVTTTIGVVTGLKSNGFFLQTPDGATDDDPSTSEGIFVFTGSPRPATPVIGDAATVKGTVSEFIPSSDPNSPPMTEISGFPTVTVVSSNNPLPAAVTLTASEMSPTGSIEQLERYEGMRVSVGSLTVTGPTEGNMSEANATSTSTGVFYGVITGIARPFREPGVEVPDPLPAGSPPNVTRFDANPERLRIDSDAQPGATRIDVTAGAVVTNLVGPLDYSSRTYTIDPDAVRPPSVSGNLSAIAVPIPASNQFTVATFNMERFYDTNDDPNISDVALTPAAFNNRLNKASLAIRNILRTPDIIGVEEMENLATLQAVAAKVNSDAIAAGQPNPGYQAYLQEGNDVGGIDVGFLVKAPRIVVTNVTQIGKDASYTDPTTGQPALLNDRPPLVLQGTVQSSSGPSFPVTVIVNHLRSLSGIDDPADGNRVRTKRRAEAEYLANYIQSLQVADPTNHIISVGDYNAYQFSDGYVDVMGTIKGTPAPADQVVLAGNDLVNPDLIDLVDLAPADQRYSYVFGGSAQELDHILITGNLQLFVSGIAYGRNDADFPEVFRNDPIRPERISDHDPIVAYFTLPAGTQTEVSASPNPSATGQSVTFVATVTKQGNPVTQGSVTFKEGTTTLAGPTALDAAGQASFNMSTLSVGDHTIIAEYSGGGTLGASTGNLVQTVIDNIPPTTHCPENVFVTVDHDKPGADVTFEVTATDNCGVASVTAIPPSGSLFPPGVTTVTGTATDVHGNRATCSFTVTVNRSPDCTAAVPSLTEIWPPDHQFVNVTIKNVSDPDGDPLAVTITKITQDEPLNTNGDGNTEPDGGGLGTSIAQVRAERSGANRTPGNGRVYEISFTASDGRGGTSEGKVKTCVPFSQGKGKGCIDDGQKYNSVTGSIESIASMGSITDQMMELMEVGTIPSEYNLWSAYPNPFNPSTTIQYDLPEPTTVQLAIYDMLGREATTLVNGHREAGRYLVRFDAKGLPSGMYIYRIHAGQFVQSRKFLLLR